MVSAALAPLLSEVDAENVTTVPGGPWSGESVSVAQVGEPQDAVEAEEDETGGTAAAAEGRLGEDEAVDEADGDEGADLGVERT